jgi:hypothetical protein
MSKSKKLALAVATAWPLVYMVFFIVFFFSTFFAAGIASQRTGAASSPTGPPLFLLVFFGLHLLTMLLVFGLIAYYIVHLFKTERIPSDKKALWGIVLFMGNIFAMPVYWYLYIWRDLPPPTRSL